jgi:DNA-binding NarL/FixJ family response regulator
MKPIRLLFVDDHPALLAGMAALFAADRRFEVVGSGSNAQDAVTLAQVARPDVMIVDLSMPGNVLGAIESICASSFSKVIVFTAYDDVDRALQAINAGAHGYVLKGRPTSDLYEAIDTVVGGDIFVSPDFARRLMAGMRNRTRREREAKAAQLSPREQQIVAHLLQGRSNKEIARDLGLSEKTIKHYMTNLMSKLRVKSRLEVVAAARRQFDGGDAIKS